MIPLLQLNRKPKYLFIALLLASFAVAQSARAVIPEPEGSNPDRNMTVEETADLDVSSGEANAATGQQANENHPNRRTFRFNFRDMRQCAGGNVTMGAELVITFQNVFRSTFAVMKPKFVAVTAFSGTVQSANRALRVESVDIMDASATPFGSGEFKIEMIVTGPALPGGRPLRFRVLFAPNTYKFNGPHVTELNPDRTPSVQCIN